MYKAYSLIIGITSMIMVTACSTFNSSVTKQSLNNAYMKGYREGIQHEQAQLTHSDIVKKEVPARIVGGVYIPAHTEYVVEKTTKQVETSSRTGSVNSIKPAGTSFQKNAGSTPRVPSPETIEESTSTIKPAPLPDPNRQARLFETLVNNYNFDEADTLYRNVITYINPEKIKDRFSYYMALGKYLLVRHDYQNAYDSFQKAYFTAKGTEEQLQALEKSVTAAKLTGNKDLEFTALLNLGDFKLTRNDKLGALECYYRALKIKSTPAVNLRIANILQGMGKKQLAKAFALKAYILGRR